MSEILPDLLQFIGGRPLVGYYIDFDIAMLNNHVAEFLGIQLPNPRIEVSGIYYDRKYGDAPPGTQIDLTFANILQRPEPALVQPARRFFRRADDSDDLRQSQGLQGKGNPHSAGRAKGVSEFHGG